MDKNYTPSTMTYTISESVSEEVKVPEMATAAQVAKFDRKLAEIDFDVIEQIDLAYLSAFDVEFIREVSPNECEELEEGTV